MEKNNKTIMVTGGAGFLGSHLCEFLLRGGARVICIDNFISGDRRNLDSFADHPAFTFVEHDIREPIDLHADEIYNLACPASPRHYQADPIATLQTCVIGTSNLLELARECGAKLLQASTSEVYGNPLSHPQRETDWGNVNPVGLRACYDEGKRAAEALCFDHLRVHDTRIKVARIFNTYGPRMDRDDGRVISNFIVQALSGDPITVFGDGSQTRSFCYYTDLIAGLTLLMDAPHGLHGPVNLGNPAEFTILELAQMVREMTGCRAGIDFEPLPEDDPRQRRPDISLARRTLGWQPRVDLARGLARTLNYFESVLESGQLEKPRRESPARLSGFY